MNYKFKVNGGIKFGVNTGKNMKFGVSAGNSNSTVPENVVTSDTIKHIEAVSKQWYMTNRCDKHTLYIIKEE